MDPLCSNCNEPLPDKRPRKRQRSRKCRQCYNKIAAERRENDPVRRLQHKWHNSAVKRWPRADPSLWSLKTVKEVYERCDKKCIITGLEDPTHLCVTYIIYTDEPPPTDQLIVISTHEAQSIGRASNERRVKHFPKEIQQRFSEYMVL